MSTHSSHAAARPMPLAGLGGAEDWARITVATLARSLVAALLAMGFWAAAPLVAGWQPTTVMSGSMEPTVNVGDVVVARPTAVTALLPGQVLLFDDPDHPGRLRLHRFHATGPHGTIVTKGDANPQADSTPLQRSAVHGVALTRVPYIGLPVVWMREGDWGRIALAVAVLMGLLLLCGADAALRRAPASEQDRSPARSPAHVSVAAQALATRRERLRRRRLRRRKYSASLLTSAIALTGAGCLLPAEAIAAPFTRTTSNPTSTFASTSAVPATNFTCAAPSSGFTITIGWSYGGVVPATFDVLVNGSPMNSSPIQATAPVSPATTSSYTQSYTPSSGLSLGSTYTIAVRTNLSTIWTASTAAATAKVTAIIGSGSVTCTAP